MKRSHGFSMIEVLITLLLTSVGILVMLALQAKSIQYTQDSVNRNTAVSLTSSIMEVMRTYRDELYSKTPPDHLIYSELKGSSMFYTTSGLGGLGFSESDCPSQGVAQTAKQAAGCWLQKVSKHLPGAATENTVKAKFRICPSIKLNNEGEVVCESGGYKGSSIGIQLAWKSQEKVCGKNSNSDICTYVMRVEI